MNVSRMLQHVDLGLRTAAHALLLHTHCLSTVLLVPSHGSSMKRVMHSGSNLFKAAPGARQSSVNLVVTDV